MTIPTPEMIAAIEAKKYRHEQGIDAEMASFNDGLDAAISIVRSALSSPEPVAWRWRWKDSSTWIVSNEEPDALANRVIETLYVKVSK